VTLLQLKKMIRLLCVLLAKVVAPVSVVVVEAVLQDKWSEAIHRMQT
jgi:hypothetical protein